MTTVFLCFLSGLALFALWVLTQAIKIVREWERLVVLRLGRVVGVKGPGLVFLIPILDRGIRVSLRERVREIPHQTCITKDNASISVDFIWYYKVLDPLQSVMQVEDFESAAQGMATTTLRAVIGGMLLDEVLSQREAINELLRTRLDEVTERWGVKVTNVEIREIIPPREIQEAMNRQMSAERNRRALVTESMGKKEAAINVAEGEKQATILRAQGEREAQILRAEAERQAAILRAEGFAKALEKINQVAQTLDQRVITLQYLTMMEGMASTPSTKFVIPMEFTKFMQDLGFRSPIPPSGKTHSS